MPYDDARRDTRRSSYLAPGTGETPVQRASRPLPLAYGAEPVTATRPVPVQRQAAPQRRAAPPTLAAPPLVITRPLPVQQPRAIVPAPRTPRPAVRRAPRSVKRAMVHAVRTGPVPTVTAPAAPATPRHIGRALIAMLGVCGLMIVTGLPAFSAELSSAPPTGGYADGDTQEFQAGGNLQPTSPNTADGWDTVDAPTWISPIVGRLGDPYGPRPVQPVPGVSLFHRGQDIVASCGTPIHAAADGVVTTATYWGTYGNWILIDDGNGIATGYAHAERMLVTPGEHVQAGQVIGLVGETGAATGCHLHLEVHVNGTAINPVPFFTAKGVRLGS